MMILDSLALVAPNNISYVFMLVASDQQDNVTDQLSMVCRLVHLILFFSEANLSSIRVGFNPD